jgi:transcriptional regulator with XRE-family HTH domain
MTPFGERMREMRRARGVTQKDMARALGVSADR